MCLRALLRNVGISSLRFGAASDERSKSLSELLLYKQLVTVCEIISWSSRYYCRSSAFKEEPRRCTWLTCVAAFYVRAFLPFCTFSLTVRDKTCCIYLLPSPPLLIFEWGFHVSAFWGYSRRCFTCPSSVSLNTACGWWTLSQNWSDICLASPPLWMFLPQDKSRPNHFH